MKVWVKTESGAGEVAVNPTGPHTSVARFGELCQQALGLGPVACSRYVANGTEMEFAGQNGPKSIGEYGVKVNGVVYIYPRLKYHPDSELGHAEFMAKYDNLAAPDTIITEPSADSPSRWRFHGQALDGSPRMA